MSALPQSKGAYDRSPGDVVGERDQRRVDFGGLLLLDPMAGIVDQDVAAMIGQEVVNASGFVISNTGSCVPPMNSDGTSPCAPRAAA